MLWSHAGTHRIGVGVSFAAGLLVYSPHRGRVPNRQFDCGGPCRIGDGASFVVALPPPPPPRRIKVGYSFVVGSPCVPPHQGGPWTFGAIGAPSASRLGPVSH